jgi:hypothetical protein
LLYSLRKFHTEPAPPLDGGITLARAQATTTDAKIDCLVNKLRGRLIRTLFIKLQLIFDEWSRLVVNRTLLFRVHPA